MSNCKYCTFIIDENGVCENACMGSQLKVILDDEDNVLERVAGILNEINKSLSFIADEYAKENVRKI